MYKFLTVLFMFVSACCAITGGLALVVDSGWEIGLGWCIWSAVFYKAGQTSHKFTP